MAPLQRSFESLLHFFRHQGFRGLAIQALQALGQAPTGAAAHAVPWTDGCGTPGMLWKLRNMLIDVN